MPNVNVECVIANGMAIVLLLRLDKVTPNTSLVVVSRRVSTLTPQNSQQGSAGFSVIELLTLLAVPCQR